MQCTPLLALNGVKETATKYTLFHDYCMEVLEARLEQSLRFNSFPESDCQGL